MQKPWAKPAGNPAAQVQRAAASESRQSPVRRERPRSNAALTASLPALKLETNFRRLAEQDDTTINPLTALGASATTPWGPSTQASLVSALNKAALLTTLPALKLESNFRRLEEQDDITAYALLTSLPALKLESNFRRLEEQDDTMTYPLTALVASAIILRGPSTHASLVRARPSIKSSSKPCVPASGQAQGHCACAG